MPRTYSIAAHDITHNGRGLWHATIEKDGSIIADRAPVVWEHQTTAAATAVWFPATPAGRRDAQAFVGSVRPLVAIAKGEQLEDGTMRFDGFVGLAVVNAKRKPWREVPSPGRRLRAELTATVDVVERLD